MKSVRKSKSKDLKFGEVVQINKEDITNLFKQFDKNENGHLEFDEILKSIIEISDHQVQLDVMDIAILVNY